MNDKTQDQEQELSVYSGFNQPLTTNEFEQSLARYKSKVWETILFPLFEQVDQHELI